MGKCVEADQTTVEDRVSTFARTLVQDGRNLADRLANQLPEAASGGRDVLTLTQRGVDHLSDGGIVAAMALSTGFAAGLIVAGAPRLVLAMAVVPMGLVARSLVSRGISPSGLLR